MADKEHSPSSLNLAFVEELYADFLRDPASVPEDWRRYFEEVGPTDGFGSRPDFGPTFRTRSYYGPREGVGPPDRGRAAELAALQHRVTQLIRNYRVRGHIVAQVDPLGMPRPQPPELNPSYYGFTEADLDRPVSSESLASGKPRTLREVLQCLRNTYCRSIGVQFMHIDALPVREWLQTRMEGSENRLDLSRDTQLRILTRLTDAVIFEEFVQRKYTGAKSFSLEGAESLIPLLDLAIEKAGDQGIEQIVLSMAHRGRLNVLAHIMGKAPRQIFREFEDVDPDLYVGRGDVKYHVGYSNDWVAASGNKVHLSLCFNPGHLEYINPVAMGRMRAKQDRMADRGRMRGMALMIHGDASFAGEGIIQETLNLSELEGYTTGGTLHVILNNQIGFTTTPVEGRSSTYATAVARMLQIPIFHVNGEDPEAVAQVVGLAMDYRCLFMRDVIIDMYCYRRRGHNEGDDPTFTQPILYRAIKKRKSVRQGYLDHLLTLGGVTRQEADEIAAGRREYLEAELAAARDSERMEFPASLQGIWAGYQGGADSSVPEVDTGVDRGRLATLLEAMTEVPEDFHPHRKVLRWLDLRRQMARGEKPLDWAAAEALAFATLATEGFRIRLSGQDSVRGTFSQRHAVLYDYEDGRPHMPLQHLDKDQGPIEIYNSPLSEAGVMGFEYGYSLDWPDGLFIWEAQFGDFSNAAQVIIDQFVASAEDKWQRLSGLVLLLPHGFEGMGPEHSHARLERFLLLAAEDNIQIVNPTAPAQYFHCLRRQAVRKWRKPLIVMMPKSLLRHPEAVSTLDELAQGRFQRVLTDDAVRPEAVKRVLLCSGKFYYELAQEREKLGRTDVAIVRIEQFYPLDKSVLESVLDPYPDGVPVFWIQEEPLNMGAWRYIRARYGSMLLEKFPFSGITRPVSASPATGSASSHRIEQEELVKKAFSDTIVHDGRDRTRRGRTSSKARVTKAGDK